MDRYILYCTEAQTKNALKLGAPINIFVHTTGEVNGCYRPIGENIDAIIPTTEEMIGWLEEQKGLSFDIYEIRNGWTYNNIYKNSNDSEASYTYYNSRKEATIAAIDAALEYLTNNKK